MNAATTSLRCLGETLVVPRQAWRLIAREPHPGALAAWVCAAYTAIALVQTRVAWGVLAGSTEPDWADLEFSAPILAAGIVVASALATGVRSVLLAVVMGFVVPSSFPRRIALALALEAIPLVESAATMVVIGLDPPADFAALRAARLQSGLDLFWRPSNDVAAAIVGAANGFAVWWGLACASGVHHVLGASRRRAAWIAIALVLTRIAVRAAWSVTP